ncbi:MAG TPA: histone deacetylase [Roseiflexaceae bacterium]|nr:histone deacetylase [Roseiflexaceae bacterium]
MTTAIVTNPLHALHDEPSHEEQAARLQAIDAAIDASGLRADMLELAATEVREGQILAVHQPMLLEIIRATARHGPSWIGMDTYTTPGSWDAARMAAGAALHATQAVLAGQASNAFALIRPPGHHATPSQPMGFCLLNNIAIAARHATDALGVARVAIVDFDVHHGNGTQDCFYDDGQVFFCSTHASPLYPGTGAADEAGIEDGYGTTLNLPLPYGTGDVGFGLLFDQVVLPALRSFAPELILVSAGYDAHWDDPLGPLSLSINGFAGLTQRLVGLATEICGGKIVFVLEGGYSKPALAGGVVASLRVLLGLPPGDDPLGPAGRAEPDITTLIRRTRDRHPIFQFS